MIMKRKHRLPQSVTDPKRYKYGCVDSQLSVATTGDVGFVGIPLEYKTPQEIANDCSLDYLRPLRRRAARIPQWFRDENPEFDKKLSLVEEAIQIKVA